MTETLNKQVSSLTGLIGRKTAVVAVVLLLLIVCSVNILSGGEASIGGFSESPTAFKVVVTTSGAISIFAPADTVGHWEISGEHFSDQSAVLFSPMERFGIKKYTFVPDDPDRCRSSVYTIICKFAG